ncbi:hypothetical protein Hamer_G001977, partial [Homarus americanus]
LLYLPRIVCIMGRLSKTQIRQRQLLAYARKTRQEKRKERTRGSQAPLPPAPPPPQPGPSNASPSRPLTSAEKRKKRTFGKSEGIISLSEFVLVQKECIFNIAKHVQCDKVVYTYLENMDATMNQPIKEKIRNRRPISSQRFTCLEEYFSKGPIPHLRT